MHTSKRLLSAAVLGLTALIFGGCQTAQEPTAIVSSAAYWQQMQQKLQQVTRYQLSGRLGVSGSTRFSANFTLTANQDNYELELTSPFGATLANLTVKPGEAILVADGKTYQAADAQSLFYETFNLDLPLSSLRTLSLGLIGPASILLPDGQLLSSAQDGFVVNYQHFKEFDGYALPTDLNVNKGQLYIKLKVNEVAYIE